MKRIIFLIAVIISTAGCNGLLDFLDFSRGTSDSLDIRINDKAVKDGDCLELAPGDTVYAWLEPEMKYSISDRSVAYYSFPNIVAAGPGETQITISQNKKNLLKISIKVSCANQGKIYHISDNQLYLNGHSTGIPCSALTSDRNGNIYAYHGGDILKNGEKWLTGWNPDGRSIIDFKVKSDTAYIVSNRIEYTYDGQYSTVKNTRYVIFWSKDGLFEHEIKPCEMLDDLDESYIYTSQCELFGIYATDIDNNGNIYIVGNAERPSAVMMPCCLVYSRNGFKSCTTVGDQNNPRNLGYAYVESIAIHDDGKIIYALHKEHIQFNPIEILIGRDLYFYMPKSVHGVKIISQGGHLYFFASDQDSGLKVYKNDAVVHEQSDGSVFSVSPSGNIYTATMTGYGICFKKNGKTVLMKEGDVNYSPGNFVALD